MVLLLLAPYHGFVRGGGYGTGSTRAVVGILGAFVISKLYWCKEAEKMGYIIRIQCCIVIMVHLW
jgi:hypothetical protein